MDTAISQISQKANSNKSDNSNCVAVTTKLWDEIRAQFDEMSTKISAVNELLSRNSLDSVEVEHRAVVQESSHSGEQTPKTKEKKKLVIGALASYAHLDRRMGIRETWTNYLKNTARDSEWTFKFFLGIPANLSILDEVKAEQNKYKDIIFVPYLDNYLNLTQKTMAMARWAVENFEFEFFMKIDDDSFLRLDWLMDELNHLPKERTYTGISVGPFRPDRDPKSIWYMPRDLWPSDSGPTVITGPGYILSYDCASYLAKKSLDPKLVVLPLEDVNTAVILSEMGVHGTTFGRFTPGACPCRSNMILSHWCSPSDFRRFYQKSQAGSDMCR